MIASVLLHEFAFLVMSLQIAKLGLSKNIRTPDGARHFVTKITSWPSGWCKSVYDIILERNEE